MVYYRLGIALPKKKLGIGFSLMGFCIVFFHLSKLIYWLSIRYRNQSVAIKIVHRGDTPEEIAKREGRFAREVAMLSRVQHKNLAKVGFDSELVAVVLDRIFNAFDVYAIVISSNDDHTIVVQQFIGACNEPVMVIVTELLLGGTLRRYLLNMRPRCLDTHVAVGFALDIARAVECLHSHGIIHRDLKPGNSNS